MADQKYGMAEAVRALAEASAQLSKAVSEGAASTASEHVAGALRMAAQSVDNAARKVNPRRVSETRNEVLHAAGEVFAEKGFDAATVDEIAQRAGRSKGSVYAHFASKDELMLALMEETLCDDEGDETSQAAVEALATGQLPALIDRAGASSVSLLLGMEMLSYSLRRPEHAHRYARVLAQQKKHLERYIGQQIPDAQPEAALAFATIVNLGTLYASFGEEIADGDSITEVLNRAIRGTIPGEVAN